MHQNDVPNQDRTSKKSMAMQGLKALHHDKADVDKNGTIDSIKFITAIMDRQELDREENLYKAFQFFDKDNSGFITRDELKHSMNQYEMGDEQTIDEVLDDIDTDKDGKITYDDFMNI
ncbi:calcium-dependent protein kinase 29 [Tanacetum coccineum]